MKSEIKFRAWNKFEKRMWFDVQIAYDYTTGHTTNNGDSIPANSFGDILEDNDWIVMQYTGLKDKNGKEIYRGDIVRICTSEDIDNDVLMKCEFRDNGFGFYGKDDSRTGALNNDFKEFIEVVGNIYEHKHLFKID